MHGAIPILPCLENASKIVRARTLRSALVLFLLFVAACGTETFFDPPKLEGITPDVATGGDILVLRGMYFGREKQPGSRVVLGDIELEVKDWSASAVTVLIPHELESGSYESQIHVGGQASEVYRIQIVPTFASLSSTDILAGENVTLRGSNFGSSVDVMSEGARWQASHVTLREMTVSMPDRTVAGTYRISLQIDDFSTPYKQLAVWPALESLSPDMASGDDIVVLHGKGFSSPSLELRLGSWNTYEAETQSHARSMFTIPRDIAGGEYDVSVMVNFFESEFIMFAVRPQIEAISPAIPARVGAFELVTLTGSNFGEVWDDVRIWVAGTEVYGWSTMDSILFELPESLPGGEREVMVEAGGIKSAPRSIVIEPRLEYYSKDSGHGGTSITLTGTNFGDSEVYGRVLVGDVEASISSWSGTSITFLVPNTVRSGAQTVRLEVGGLSAGTAPFQVLPTLQSITPAMGYETSSIILTGGNFGSASMGSDNVVFNATSARILDWKPQQITLQPPIGLRAGSFDISVVVAGLSTISREFVLQHRIDALSSGVGVEGDVITISGSAFGPSQSDGVVRIGGAVATVFSWGASSIQVQVPPAAPLGPTLLTIEIGGEVVSATFQVSPAPLSLAQLSPAEGSWGTSVELTGSGFGASQGASRVHFAGVTATTYHSWSSLRIVAEVPSGMPPGVQSARVIVDGTMSEASPFRLKPVIATVAPVPVTAGTAFSVIGSAFGETGVLEVSGIPFDIVTWTSSAITANILSAVEPGNHVVHVISMGETSNPMTMSVAPFIVSLDSTAPHGNDIVKVMGTNFGAQPGTVTIRSATSEIISWSPTEVRVRVPRTIAPGPTTLQINAGGRVASKSLVVYPVLLSVSPLSVTNSTSISFVAGNIQTNSQPIWYGNVVGPSSSLWTFTSVFASVPADLTAGIHNVTVDVNSYFSNAVSLHVRPSIWDVNPAEVGAGQNITLTGRGFGESQGDSSISVGGISATVQNWAPRMITATVPGAADIGLQNVVVTVGAQESDIVGITVIPNITSISPAIAYGQETVSVSGFGFGATQGTGILLLSHTATTALSWSNTLIEFQVPVTVYNGQFPIQIERGSSHSNIQNLTIRPFIEDVATAPAGGTITITGRNLLRYYTYQILPAVLVNGAQITKVNDSMTQVQAQLPASLPAGSHTVQLRYTGTFLPTEQTNILSFTVPLVLTGVTPPSGGWGETLTLSGSGFGTSVGASTVTIGGVSVDFVSWSQSEVGLLVPNGLALGETSLVITVGGEVQTTPFTLISAIAALSPDTGSGGTSITIVGYGLGDVQGSSMLLVGAETVTPYAWSSTSVSFTIPNDLAAGDVAVRLEIDDVETRSLLLRVRPVLKSITPTVVSPQGELFIEGTNLGASGANGSFYIAESPIEIDTWAWNQVEAFVPILPLSGNFNLYAVVNGISSNSLPVDYRRVWLEELNPTRAWAGLSVSLSGREFGDSSGVVTIGGESAIVEGWTNDLVQVQVPANVAKGKQPVIVETFSGTASNPIPITIRGHDVWFSESTPEARSGHVAVWTGMEMVVWGGGHRTGGRYNPVIDVWQMMNLDGSPTSIAGHAAVWTGFEMIVFNGQSLGGRYNPATDTWSTISGTGAPSGANVSAVWTGDSMLIWSGSSREGGQYYPLSNSWAGIPSTGAPSVRSDYSAVWADGELIVWGGLSSGVFLADGARYSRSLSKWEPLSSANAPSARYQHLAVWTGTEMLIWGGCNSTGIFSGCSLPFTLAKYNPTSDIWTQTSVPVSSRIQATAIWTGTEMIIWGGRPSNPWSTATEWGARFNPTTSAWETLPTVNSIGGRTFHTAVWTGTEMLVWGGTLIHTQGSRYDRSQDAWLPMVPAVHPRVARTVWTGTQLLAWGGLQSGTQGHRYLPDVDMWLPLTPLNAPVARTGFSAVWANDKMLIWGGRGADQAYLSSGAAYNPATDTWSATNLTGAPSARFLHSAVWTGSEMLVWGGTFYNGSAWSYYSNGARYSPGANSWSALPTSGVPSARRDHSAVWTGNEMIIWGGYGVFGQVGDGRRYSRALDAWSTMTAVDGPAARYGHNAAWTGTQMMIFGGTPDSIPGRYDPLQNLWLSVATAGSPFPRASAPGVWTGEELIVWGGTTRSGAAYDPAANSWSPVTTLYAPMNSVSDTAVWTGDTMLVLGTYGFGTYWRDVPK
jgi:hypothetical protein